MCMFYFCFEGITDHATLYRPRATVNEGVNSFKLQIVYLIWLSLQMTCYISCTVIILYLSCYSYYVTKFVLYGMHNGCRISTFEHLLGKVNEYLGSSVNGTWVGLHHYTTVYT